MTTFRTPEQLNIRVQAAAKKSPTKSNTILPTLENFMPIGIGKPLVIRLHTVYVGNLKTGIFTNKQSILVTSLIKDDITFEVPPRGLHQFFKAATDRTTLYPQAANEGTELIYYSRAFSEGKLLIDIEVKADRFNQNVVDDISSVLGTSSALPVFAPFAPFILAGSQLLKMGGSILNTAIEKFPVLRYTFNVYDDLGGLRNTSPGYLLGGNREDLETFRGYSIVEDEFSPGNVYLMIDGERYKGDIPYVIISLDGRVNQNYNNFKATVASASLLKKFYGISDSSQVEDIQSMLSLYNDFTFIDKYRKLKKSLSDESDPKEQEKIQQLMEAYKANISNDDFQKVLQSEKTAEPSNA